MADATTSSRRREQSGSGAVVVAAVVVSGAECSRLGHRGQPGVGDASAAAPGSDGRSGRGTGGQRLEPVAVALKRTNNRMVSHL